MQSSLYASYKTIENNQNTLSVFNNQEFGEIRVLEINNEPWFVGKDVATALGYSNTRKALIDHIDSEDKGVTKCDTLKGKQEMTIINESGLYSLILGSKLPSAKKFKRWVTSEVLPTIRKHGAYMTTEVIEKTLSNPDFIIQLAGKLKEEQQKRKLAEEENIKLSKIIECQKPRVEYADKILNCKDAMLVTNIAFDYVLSAQALNKILCEERVQRKVRKQYILYADYMGKGFTETETEEYGGKARTQTLWTQKGRMLIHQILSKRNIKPLEDMAM